MSRLDALLYDLLEPDPRQPVRLRLEVDWAALRRAAGLTVREVAARVPMHYAGRGAFRAAGCARASCRRALGRDQAAPRREQRRASCQLATPGDRPAASTTRAPSASKADDADPGCRRPHPLQPARPAPSGAPAPAASAHTMRGLIGASGIPTSHVVQSTSPMTGRRRPEMTRNTHPSLSLTKTFQPWSTSACNVP